MKKLEFITLITIWSSAMGTSGAQGTISKETRTVDEPSNGVLELIVGSASKDSNSSDRGRQGDASAPSNRGQLEISLKNVSKQIVKIMVTSPMWDFDIQVNDDSGKRAPLTDAGKRLPQSDRERQEWMLSRKIESLEPGEEYRVKVDLSLYYVIQQRQDYTVSVRRGVAGVVQEGRLVPKHISRSIKLMRSVE